MKNSQFDGPQFGDLRTTVAPVGEIRIEGWVTCSHDRDENRFFVEGAGIQPVEMTPVVRPDVATFFGTPELANTGLVASCSRSLHTPTNSLRIRSVARTPASGAGPVTTAALSVVPKLVVCSDYAASHDDYVHLRGWIAGDNVLAVATFECPDCTQRAWQVHRFPDRELAANLGCHIGRLFRYDAVLAHARGCASLATGRFKLAAIDFFGNEYQWLNERTNHTAEVTASRVQRHRGFKQGREARKRVCMYSPRGMASGRTGLLPAVKNITITAASRLSGSMKSTRVKHSFSSFDSLLGTHTIVVVNEIVHGGALLDTLERLQESGEVRRNGRVYLTVPAFLHYKDNEVLCWTFDDVIHQKSPLTLANTERQLLNNFDAAIVVSWTLAAEAVDLSRSKLRTSLIGHELSSPLELAARADNARAMDALQNDMGSVELYAVANFGSGRGVDEKSRRLQQRVNLLPPNYNPSLTVSPATTSVSPIEPQVRLDGIDSPKVEIVMFGPLAPHKQQKFALDCICSSDVLLNRAQISFIGIDSDHDRLTLEEYVSKGLRIRCLPTLSQPWDEIRKNAVVVIASSTEFLPRVLIEALSRGNSVVCTDAVSPSALHITARFPKKQVSYFRSENGFSLRSQLESFVQSK